MRKCAVIQETNMKHHPVCVVHDGDGFRLLMDTQKITRADVIIHAENKTPREACLIRDRIWRAQK